MKEMEELKDLQSDLEALRELYGFLQCGGDVANNGITLRERSKLLLKNLLDGFTKRVLETHDKKIIEAAELNVCDTSYTFESEKGRVLSEFDQSYVSPNMLKGGPNLIPNFMKESNYTTISSLKDEDSPNKLRSPEVISHQSRPSFSIHKPESRKKYCEMKNKHSSMKQKSMARTLSKDSEKQVQQCDPLGYFYEAGEEERKLLERNETNKNIQKSNETMRQRSIFRLQSTPSVVGSLVGSSTSLVSGDYLINQDGKEGEAVNNFSKDVDNVVKHIESHILALRLCSKLADATKGTLQHGLCKIPTAVSSRVQAEEHLVKQSKLSPDVELFSDWDELQLSHQTTACRVHGLKVLIKQDDITKRPSMPVKVPYAILTNNKWGKELTPTIAKLRSPMPSGSKDSPRPINVKKSLADHEILPEQMKEGTGIFRNKILQHQQESEESATTGSDDYAATSDEESSAAGNEFSAASIEESFTASSGTGSNYSEAYSLTSQDSVPSVARRFDHGVYDESRSVSRRLDHGVYNESRSSTTTSSDYRDVGESSRLYPARTHKPVRPACSEPAEGQRLGRLRRFKNKIGLIFHHHHHHHHHHGHGHGQDHGNSTDQSFKGVYTKSTWTPLRKLFHQRNRYKADDNKLRKARASNMPVKHQVGHFRALLEGLMQHLRHSKKSKPSKGGMGYLGNDHHGHKNRKVKHLHWWQMFQRQGGVKLPNRRRVKIGFTSKKQQLRVPKLR